MALFFDKDNTFFLKSKGFGSSLSCSYYGKGLSLNKANVITVMTITKMIACEVLMIYFAAIMIQERKHWIDLLRAAYLGKN